MNKATIRKMALAIGLTFVAIGVWAQDAMLSDSIADKVTLRDGTMVKAQRVPKQAPSSDYTYTYKGVKYTYITKNNIASYFNTSAIPTLAANWRRRGSSAPASWPSSYRASAADCLMPRPSPRTAPSPTPASPGVEMPRPTIPTATRGSATKVPQGQQEVNQQLVVLQTNFVDKC